MRRIVVLSVLFGILAGCTSLSVESGDTKIVYRYCLTQKDAKINFPDGSQITFGADSKSNLEALSVIAGQIAEGAVKGAK